MMETVDILKIAASILALMVAIIGHEIMHGFIAYRYGDPTAKLSGRLSINPLVHIDPIGSIAIPLILYVAGAPFLFGWAKPVPINTAIVMRNGGYSAAIAVALAGVVYNFVLAAICSIVLGGIGEPSTFLGAFVWMFLLQSVIYNVVLGVFNLWPIPPLDGSHAISYLALWARWTLLVQAMRKMERYGMVILIIVLITPLKNLLFLPASIILSLLLG